MNNLFFKKDCKDKYKIDPNKSIISYFCRVKRSFFLLFTLIISRLGHSQDHDLPIRHYGYDLIDRWEIQSTDASFSTFRPFARKNLVRLVSQVSPLSSTGQFQKEYLLIENREYADVDSLSIAGRPFLKHFYRHKSDLYSYSNENFDLHINPVFELSTGFDTRNNKLLYRNGRGIELRGTIDDKVAFYTRATTNQVEYPVYVKDVADSVGLVPYEGFWKEFDDTKADFFRAFAYVDFGLTKHISAQAGFGRHFIGDGERSLMLSDFGNSYPYLRIDTEIWRFRFTNLFAELISDVSTFPGGTLGNSDYPTKYMAMHHLDINVARGFNIGLFESIIMGRPDSVRGGSQFELKYAIPTIFYRALEQHDGSDYNALVGMNFKWDIYKRARFYGQFVLDELVISNMIERNGWWSNKYAYQLGLKYVDLLVSNLDITAEINSARPFTYAHDDLYTSYTHYEQPLAHPLGASFNELLLKIEYRPVPRFDMTLMGLRARYGKDTNPGFSVGRNPGLSQNLFENEFGNEIGQGLTTDLVMGSLRASYQLRHNFFLNADVTYRSESNNQFETSSIFSTVGFRWNMPNRNYLF